MFAIPDRAMQNVTITGPLWSAQMAVLNLADSPEQAWTFRTLLVELTGRRGLGQDHTLLPGTMILLGQVQQVTVNLTEQGQPSAWERSSASTSAKPATLTDELLRAHLVSGYWSLLLVQANPADWPEQSPTANRPDFFPDSLTCLAGEILLGAQSGLNPAQTAASNLYDRLPIAPATEAFAQRSNTPPASRLLSEISVHSSGLSIYGEVQLPWLLDDTPALRAPFWLTTDFPQKTDGHTLRLRPDVERFTQDDEIPTWVDAWQALSHDLNPNHPLNQSGLTEAVTPQWVTLELTTPHQVPDLYWLLAPASGTASLRFEPDEFSLLVSDRPPYDGQNPPTSTARIAPAQVAIAATADGLTIDFDTQLNNEFDGTRPDQRDRPALAVPSLASDQLQYRYEPTATSTQSAPQFDETFTAAELQTAFNAIAVTQFLRGLQGRPLGAADEVSQAPLWGFMPLADGWAQLPVPNLTEQIYLNHDLDNATLTPLNADAPAAAASQETRSLLQGAVILGNEAVLSTYSEEQPWNLTWTDAQRVRGRWQFGRQTQRWAVQSINLTIDDPNLVINGLFWLATQPPRIIDALPDLEDWVTGLQSFALAIARPDQDLFPSPVLMAVEDLQLKARSQQVSGTNDNPEFSAELTAWQLTYRLDERASHPDTADQSEQPAGQPLTVFERMVQKQVIPADLFNPSPLIWQHHERLPMVQALPLTQAQTPPNYPSASRQLMPCELKFADDTGSFQKCWQFAATGANAWPKLVTTAGTETTAMSTLASALPVRSQTDLPLVSLSLPGLQFTPSEAAPSLPQYRFDLPYTDEINAFAQLPQPPQAAEAVSPLPQSPPPAPPQPLIRSALVSSDDTAGLNGDQYTYDTYWQQLSDRASLASADGVAAFDLDAPADASDKRSLRYLVEPYSWSVDPDFQLEEYPGTLSLQNGASLALTGNSALAGIAGQFSLTAGQLSRLDDNGQETDDEPPLTLVAGSLQAHLRPTGWQDQRGLVRGVTQAHHSLLQTPVLFHPTATQTVPYALTTTRTTLHLTAGGESWHLWFRDLPLQLDRADQTATGTFSRASRLSSQTADINDPDSRSRDRDFLSGYEWRLGSTMAPQKSAYLELFNLHFYPLTLETVSFEAGQVQQVVVIGRLQLPLSPPQELTDFSNAVRLKFTQSATQTTAQPSLSLDEVSLVSTGDDSLPSQGEWPLALEQGEVSDAPLLTWQNITLTDAKDGLLLHEAHLKFVLFDYLWNVPLTQPLTQDLDFPADWSTPPDDINQTTHAFLFTQSQTDVSQNFLIPRSEEPHQPHHLTPHQLTIVLNFEQSAQHQANLTFLVQLGAATSDSIRSSFTAAVQFSLLESESAQSAQWQQARLLDELSVHNHTDASFYAGDRAFQFHWQTGMVSGDNGALPNLFPGMPLRRQNDDDQSDRLPLPGFATLTFDVVSPTDTDSGVPALPLTSAFVEMLLFCRWGEFLQTEASSQTNEAIAGSLTQVFGSTAGDLTCSYTADFEKADFEEAAGIWHETLILNGMLEIKNLISWPQGLSLDAAAETSTLLLPSLFQTLEKRELNHRRHSLRILLNQHTLPLSELAQDHRRDLHLFRLAADASWEFLAVVEHQLVDIQYAVGQEPPKIAGDRRWTVSQPVRWLTPAQFKTQLAALEKTSGLDPTTGTAPAGAGYFDATFRKELILALDQLIDQDQPILLIEASTNVWINQTALPNLSATTLQFLPTGSQLGILSNPAQYSPTDPQDPEWLLSTLPFLGRLQVPLADGLNAAPTSETNPLQVDPVYCLQTANPRSLPLMLATCQPPTPNGLPVRLPVSAFDTATGRAWSRLDSLALQESWFRLQNPQSEPLSLRLQSVIAALPDSAARMGRSIALQQNLTSYRAATPPQPQNQLLPHSIEPQIRTNNFAMPAGLQVLYQFQEDSGTIICDTSGMEPPIDLDLIKGVFPRGPWQNWERQQGPADHWRWEEDGLLISRPSLLRSRPGQARRLIEACRITHQLTIEAWIKPAIDHRSSNEPTHQGPWRIVTLSKSTTNRNFTLAQAEIEPNKHQQNAAYVVRLRTDQTSDNGHIYKNNKDLKGSPVLESAPGSLTTDLTHVVYTRDRHNLARIYVNGELLEEKEVVGEFDNWDQNAYLALANELDQQGRAGSADESRFWLGKYYRVAIYSKALTAQQIQAQFAGGYTAPLAISPYPWATYGALVATSQWSQRASSTRHAAAVLLPISSNVQTSASTLQPQSLAVSPYLGLTFQAAGQRYTPSLMSAELLCIDRVAQTLRPIASHFWEVPQDELAAPETTTDRQQRVYAASEQWARNIHAQLCPESPIAILRFREVHRLVDPKSSATEAAATDAPVITRYNYRLVSNLTTVELPSKQVFQLRSHIPQLRFSEGQWGGTELPTDLQPFELAPPQTTGIQPIYLTERPGQGDWPWGVSALRVSVRHTADSVTDTVESDSQRTLWWQAPQYSVQYRTSANGAETAGLPSLFRARAISSLLPTALKPAMPVVDPDEIFAANETDPAARWQAMLPSTMRYLLLGDRPGVFFNLRNQVLRQGQLDPNLEAATGSVFVSGSIPAQHRMPRPVPLPDNPVPQPGRPEPLALQPWASYFVPQETVWVTDTPADEAFLAADLQTGKLAQGVRLQLLKPFRGAIAADWDGVLKLALLTYNDTSAATQVNWQIKALELLVGGRPFTFTVDTSAPSHWRATIAEDALAVLRDELAFLAPGATVEVKAQVKPQVPAGEADDGFYQSLSFTLRMTSDLTLRLPLQPRFLQFEDPEYNRQLASPTAHKSTQIAVPRATGEAKLLALRLACDRREYNPDSILTWSYHWPPTDSSASELAQPDSKFANRGLQIKRIRQGIETELQLSGESQDFATVQAGQLYQMPLAQLQAANNSADTVLQAGDTLKLYLKLFEPDNAVAQDDPNGLVVLTVAIVAEPVQPAPEAAYGLLRQNPDGSVECVRFAWGVMPNRVELVNPADLKTAVVRRRAVFRWTDTVRAQQQVRYGVQKITQTGSTACAVTFTPDRSSSQ